MTSRQTAQNRTHNTVGELGTSQRILIAGSPGDGKTTLALSLLAHISPKRTVILNPGAEKIYYTLFGEASQTVDTSFPLVQHVAPPLYPDKKDYDKVWWPIIKAGNVYMLNDELSTTATESRFGDGMTYHFQQGRRRNCGQIALTQKLHRIPAFALDLADHIFVGYVQGRDLKRLEGDTQQPWAELMTKRKQYQFSYWSKHSGQRPILLPR